MAVAIPTVVRWSIDQGQLGIPFVGYFPTILLLTVFVGWRYGLLTAVLSAVIANRLFRPDPLMLPFTVRDAMLVMLFLLSCSVILWAGEALRRLVRGQEEARQREVVLKDELHHRVGNLFAVVHALAAQTANHSKPEEFVKKFEARLTALIEANRLLGPTPAAPSDLTSLVERAIRPFRTGDNFDLDGPTCTVSNEAVVPLMLALHELCTNACKYGALSRADGRVLIGWDLDRSGLSDILMDWRETGGPPVAAPTRRGLGSALLQPQKGMKAVDLEFLPSGLSARIILACE